MPREPKKRITVQKSIEADANQIAMRAKPTGTNREYMG